MTIVIGFLLTPLFIQYIPVEVYGAWLASGEVLVWITLADPGLSTVVLQKVGFFYGQDNKEEVGKYIGSGLLISLLVCAFIFILGIVAWFVLPSLLHLQDTQLIKTIQKPFLISLVGTVFLFYSFTVASLNQGLQSSLGIGLIFVLTMSSAIALNLFLLYQGHGLSSIALSTLWRGLLLLLGNSLYLYFRLKKENIKIHFDLKHIKESISILSFTFISRIASIASGNIENMLIARNINVTTVPIFAFSRKGPDIMKMFLERPFTALTPGIALSAGKGDEQFLKHNLNKIFHYLIWGISFITGGAIIFNSTFVATWLKPNFFIGFNLNILIVLMIVLQLISSAFSQLLIAIGEIKKISKVQIIHAVTHVFLVYIGSMYYGLIGLLMGTLIALITSCLWYYPYLLFKTLHFDNATMKSLMKECLIAIISIIISLLIFTYLTNIANNWLSLIAHGALYALVNSLLLLFLSKQFRTDAQQLLSLIINKLGFI